MNTAQGVTPKHGLSLPSIGWVIENVISITFAIIIGWLLLKFLLHSDPKFWALLVGAVLGRILVKVGERFSKKRRLVADSEDKAQMLRMQSRQYPGYIEVPKVKLDIDRLNRTKK